jgi:NAD+ diphosphatase
MDFDRIVHSFAGNPLDRIAAVRPDEARMAELLAAPDTLIAAFAGERPLVSVSPDGSRMDIRWMTREEVEAHGDEACPVTLLGMTEEGAARFACKLRLDGEGQAPDEMAACGKFIDLRSLAVQGLLDRTELGMLAEARSLAAWHERHGFCANCGAPSVPADGGHKRVCPACKAEHFPRTDPVAIMLVHHDGHLLLGRQARFLDGIYSCLAGFVEPGESIEETVRREIYEEAGIEVADVQYRSSQPWPFPASLMLGFRATTRDDTLRIDPEELVDVGWYGRAQLLDRERCPVKLPNRDSIARHLIEDWLYEGES